MNITVKYYSKHNGIRKFTHQYEEEWAKTEHYCPYCGDNNMYNESGPGDYYQGSQFICMSCERSSYLDNGGGYVKDSETDRQRVDQILTITCPSGPNKKHGAQPRKYA